MPEPVVAVIGAGQSGFQAASSLRQEGFAGRIVLIGDEAGSALSAPSPFQILSVGRKRPRGVVAAP